jgi:ADP-heptose:LPS heptosyltransferase
MSEPLLKRLELASRAAIIRALARLARRPHRTRTLELPDHPRILLLRHDRLGDAVISTPFFQALRERYPHARIELLLGRRNHAVASLLPSIDDTLVLGSGIAGLRHVRRVLRSRRYDVVVNLLAKDSASGAILSVIANARWRIGFAGALSDVYDFPIPRPDVPMHIVRETSLLLAPFGVEPFGPQPRREAERAALVVPEAKPDGGLVILSISSPSASRSWPDERFIELARRLIAGGLSVALASTPADRDRLEAIAAGAGAEAITPSASLAVFAAQLSRAGIVVTPQTSTVHIASALGRPTVLLNTASLSDRQWTPWGVPHRVVGIGDRVDQIPVDDVERAVRSLVGELASARA